MGGDTFFQLYFLEIVSALILGVWYKVAIPGSGVNERKVNIRRDERPLGSSMGKDRRSSATFLSAWKALQPSVEERHIVSFTTEPEGGEFGKRDEKEVGSTRGKRDKVT